ncbi:MAG TPA: RNA chaperone Hfq [Nitrospiraceae bacterium]|nr:RNA chaperone Hfq [Nitrospiraceae bacterium]
MNKLEFDGTIRDIGRYEINVEEKGKTISLLKKELSYLTAPHSLLSVTPSPPDGSQGKSSDPVETPAGKPNVQQEFLDKAMREDHMLTLFLINGQRIRAHLKAYDNFTVLLEEGGRQHLYYKHAITTINR